MKIKKKYTTKIIGDGKTKKTAFRPYFPESENIRDFVVVSEKDGKMEVEVKAEIEKHDKLKLDKDIKEK